MKALFLAVLFAAAGVSAQTLGPVSAGPAQPDGFTKVLRIELSIPAPVHDVWEAFTTQQGLSSWLAPDVSVELKPGGDWLVKFPGSTAGGTIVSFVPEKEIVINALAPDRFPQVRAARTRAVFSFTAEGIVRLSGCRKRAGRAARNGMRPMSTLPSVTRKSSGCCTIALWLDRPTGKRRWLTPRTNLPNSRKQRTPE
jgi:uncharacterized protein YndB with AHSA1/START domain